MSFSHNLLAIRTYGDEVLDYKYYLERRLLQKQDLEVRNRCSKEEPHFSMNGTHIENVNSYKHLGINRKSKSNSNTEIISERIRSRGYSWPEVQRLHSWAPGYMD